MAKSAPADPPSSDRTLHALLILTAAYRDSEFEDEPIKRSELILAEAGFSYQEIARLLARNAEAVRSAVRRQAQKKGTK